MPVANQYSIQELMEACSYYFEKTGRRITFEYSLVRGENDSKEDARMLALLAKPLVLPCESDSGQSYKGEKICAVG